MKAKKKKIAFIYPYNSNWMTKVFAKSIDCDFYGLKKLPFHYPSSIIYSFFLAMKIPRYDVYFVESAMGLFVPIFKRMLGEKNIILFRANDGLFGEKSTAYLNTKNIFKKKVLLFLINHIDIISTESLLTKKEIEKIIKVPTFITTGYVEQKTSTTPNLKSNNFLFIGEYRPPYDHKGVEFLIKSFNNISDESVHLYIIGRNTDKLIPLIKNSNIHIKGFVESLDPYYNNCCFYIHPAKYETGPMTHAEAMVRGLIPIMSNTCGHYDDAENIDKRLIIRRLNEKSIISAVNTVCNLSFRKREELSKKCVKIRHKYVKKDVLNKFRRDVKENIYQ